MKVLLRSGHRDSVLPLCFIFSPEAEDTSIICCGGLEGSLLLSVPLRGFLNRSRLTDVLSISLKRDSTPSSGRRTSPPAAGARSVWWVSHNMKEFTFLNLHIKPPLPPQSDPAYRANYYLPLSVIRPVGPSTTRWGSSTVVAMCFGWDSPDTDEDFGCICTVKTKSISGQKRLI